MKKILLIILALVLMLPSALVYADADAAEARVYTYEQALEMAQKDLSSMAAVDENLRLMKEQQDELKKQLREMQSKKNNPEPEPAGMTMMQPTMPSMPPIALPSFDPSDLSQSVPDLMDELQAMLPRLIMDFSIMTQAAIAQMMEQMMTMMMMQIMNEMMQMMAQPPTEDELKLYIRTLDKQMDSLRLNREIILAGVEMSLINSLITIASHEWDMALLEATIALNEENLTRTALRHEFGLASDNDLRTAEQALAQNRTNLENLLITLSGEKQALNKILQLPLDDEIVVEWERASFDGPEDAEALNTYIAQQFETAPTILQKQINADIKKDNWDDYRRLNRNLRRDDSQNNKLKNEYEQAQRELNDAKLALEAAIRKGSQNIDQLTTREQTLAVDAQKAADQLNTLQAHHKAGLVTQYEINQVLLAIQNAEIALEKNQNQLWLLQFAFLHPYLLS
jgi:hypothetical protein